MMIVMTIKETERASTYGMLGASSERTDPNPDPNKLQQTNKQTAA